MRNLADLGFERYRSVDSNVSEQFHAATGFVLPDSYLSFLCFREPATMPLEFRFIRADGKPWGGCVSEFHNIALQADDLANLAEQVIRPPQLPDRAFLPIGTDPGGNWLCLELSKEETTVVDVDSGSGMISRVATDFDSFLDLLQPSGEG